ncbi:MAG TPA: methyltransferase domain-containing protein [Candidatus Solibacter sp.]|nr:methyltransferase domain-containing protein [Candidatus Solibacter sp.]
MKTEERVAGHYTRGKLEEAILGAARAAGKDTAQLTAGDLAAVDEFHVGGLEATQMLARGMELRPGMHLLDVGCGIGGPVRYFAGVEGCQVTGIDLTEEFVKTAEGLTKLVKLDGRAKFRQASALAIPYDAESFDGGYMIHVGMNLADKGGAFREVGRVLKPGARFTIFDLVRAKEGALRFPLPWATGEETSFVAEAKEYRRALESAGFEVVTEKSHLPFAIEFTSRMAARIRESGPPALGLHILMGEKTGMMLKNVLDGMVEGVLDVMEIVGKKK